MRREKMTLRRYDELLLKHIVPTALDNFKQESHLLALLRTPLTNPPEGEKILLEGDVKGGPPKG